VNVFGGRPQTVATETECLRFEPQPLALSWASSPRSPQERNGLSPKRPGVFHAVTRESTKPRMPLPEHDGEVATETPSIGLTPRRGNGGRRVPQPELFGESLKNWTPVLLLRPGLRMNSRIDSWPWHLGGPPGLNHWE